MRGRTSRYEDLYADICSERSFDVYAIIMLFLQRNYAHIKYAIELRAEKTLLCEVKELLKS